MFSAKITLNQVSRFFMFDDISRVSVLAIVKQSKCLYDELYKEVPEQSKVDKVKLVLDWNEPL